MNPFFITIFSYFLYVQGHAQNLNSKENYIHSRTYLEPTKVTSSSAKQIEGVNYYDGLGRPKQNIIIKGSPTAKDIVTPVEYDAFGRQAKDYLPIPQTSTQRGGIYANPLSNASQIYGNERIYSEKIIENSPLDRLLGTIQVGNDWQNKPTRLDYGANSTSDGVKKFSTTTSWKNGATYSTLSLSGNYGDSQLYKNTVTDEDGNSVIEFKNGQGQVLLLRRFNGTEKIDTYYVYNEYNQLAFVLQPLLSSKTSVTPSDLDLLGYQYRYDGKGRLVEKKLPGKDWEYMVYDQQNRLVMTQDGNLRTNNLWLFTKYDIFNRIAFTGLASGSSRVNEQSQLNTDAKKYNNVERKDAIGLTKNNLDIYYANASTGDTYPTNIQSILSVNYYDIYPIDSDIPALPQEILGQMTLKPTPNNGVSTKSLPLVSYIKNIENDDWTKTYTYYDEKGRVIGTYTKNHLGGYTKTERKLDFAGVVQESWVYHKGKPSDRETIIKERFTYDHQNRMLEHYHQVNAQTEELLVKNNYDELGRVIIKQVGGSQNFPLQNLDYQYNIRGWLQKVNNPQQLGEDLFAFELKYHQPNDSRVSPKYNGNITEQNWISSQDGILRRYAYQYDGLDRLKKALYSKPSTTQANTGAYDEYLNYDANGNITGLSRFGEMDRAQAIKIDELRYDYLGNKLTKVQDDSRNVKGYPIGGNTITYDANGNILNHLDKDIRRIYYNHLNLPNKIIRTFGTANYIYRSDGLKIQKEYREIVSDYLDGFQYVNGVLEFVPTAEGYFDFKKNRYVYHYTDHLGNVRLSYAKNPAGNIEIVEENNYYPFGLKHKGYNQLVGNSNYQYQYNGKELQTETGMYDYGARFYIPELGRWGVIDPLAEKTLDPYGYVYNNPINLIDPTGMEADDWVKRDNQIFYDENVKSQADAERAYGKNVEYLGNGAKLTTSKNGKTISEYTFYSDGTYKDMKGNTMDNTKNVTTAGGTTIFAYCETCLNPGTLYQNPTPLLSFLKLSYPGGNNPRTYGKDGKTQYSYEYVPELLSEYPAIGHDRRYDNLKIEGASGLIKDKRAIGADWRFVGEQMAIAYNPFNGASMKDRAVAYYTGLVLGLAATPKTMWTILSNPTQGISQIIKDYHESNKGVTNQPTKR